MAYTTTQRDALQEALASGAREVTYDGKTVIYRTLDEITRALDIVNQALVLDAGTPAVRQVHLYSRKGV